MISKSTQLAAPEVPAAVYCPICTHTVTANVVPIRKAYKVKPGQRCARCQSAIDAGVVMYLRNAA